MAKVIFHSIGTYTLWYKDTDEVIVEEFGGEVEWVRVPEGTEVEFNMICFPPLEWHVKLTKGLFKYGSIQMCGTALAAYLDALTQKN